MPFQWRIRYTNPLLNSFSTGRVLPLSYFYGRIYPLLPPPQISGFPTTLYPTDICCCLFRTHRLPKPICLDIRPRLPPLGVVACDPGGTRRQARILSQSILIQVNPQVNGIIVVGFLRSEGWYPLLRLESL